MNASLPPSPLSDAQRQQIDALARELNEQQLDWVQGYLAGYRAAQQSAGAAPSATQPQGAKLTVLFGSQTGNAETLAERLTEQARAKGLEVECLDMNDFPVRRLKKEQRLAIISSTHGEGDPPDNALGLHEYLHGRKAPKLPQLQYAVLSLGDSSYEHFCQTGIDFDERLAALGGKRLTKRVDCDVDFDEPADQWITALLDQLSSEQPGGEPGPSPTTPPASVSQPQSQYDRKHPFSAPLLDRVRLNGRGSGKSVHHIELSLEDSGLSYTPGDSLGVYAQNDPRLVEQLLAQAGLDGEQIVTLKDESLTLAQALQHHLELTRLTPPTVQQWAKLSESSELHTLTENKRELIQWLHGRDLLDLLQSFPIEGLDAQTLVDHLRRLPPRLYSIASSQAAVEDEVHLTVAAVRYEQREREREGVGSTWLADRLTLDDNAPVFIDRNKNFRLPENGETPIVMIGPGTGIAPFRAFMQEREALEQPGKNWLFFGDRRFRTDFLYQREWLQWRKQGLLHRLDVAFSRDGPEKVYVQHRIREAGGELWRWLEEGAHVYVCGDANAMAPDVHEALIDVVASQGHRSRENAEQYLREMTRDKRYQRDVY
ncbi:assimilatory sulfite reductase (NADPH) flavoprotein subunit [Marinimicrobium agarilyticum]|uniref:assimilatory sulfite reductase (NADPH) flavoprotein subunit n=1 Tax=Marinimicrobium agarilyticum TaxID=306546 RepID=UPI000424FF83|nr:assimilatory sulfite reductase (NADPH) flavoprotein subunit [Marinimicrobium agarilyticum]